MYTFFFFLHCRHEVDVLLVSAYLKGVNFASFVFTERTTLYVTVVAYVLQGNVISADKVFTMAQYFNILQLTMAIFYPQAVRMAAEAKISIRRIEVSSSIHKSIHLFVFSHKTVTFIYLFFFSEISAPRRRTNKY